MADTSQIEVPPSQTNGLSDGIEDEERLKMRPADIDADVKEMERRKRVDMIMNSKLFREELERIIETQLKDGSGTSGLMQQISDMMGVSKNAGHVFKNSNCVVPINDIRGIESMGYAKGEKILRCKLAAVYRLIDLYGWAQGCSALITARLNQDEEHFLVNPYGMLFHEITASSLIKVDMQGNVVEQGTTNFSVNITAFSLHAAIHSSRPDIKCIIHVHTPSVVAISALKCGLLALSEESVVIGDISTHSNMGGVLNAEEIGKIARNLGPNNKVLLLTNQGAVCCGETIEEAFFNARNTVLACESQLKLMPMGVDNLVLITDEQRKKLYEAAHKAPESTPRPDQPSILEGKVERKWRVGGIEFEALMRMLDNAGFRTGYIYRHPLVKGEPPKPRNDVEVPPAVSSLGYLLEEEELYRQGLWKKLEGGRKGHDRTRWLNSPNVYQKVEILETGTPDPKKITKWVADGSPTHATTPVKIDSALQFVPKNTNPKEFKQLQQQIKDYRRADKISAGPQSHILEGVTWEEAKKMQDATVTQTGDQVVLMGAASKGIIQRGFQHNATMYKSPYAKNPFDSVTDEELDEYKRVVERKTKGEFDDTTDYSESEGLSSAQINKRISDIRSPTSITSETEEESRDEPQILRIETTHAPKPSQPEVVMSDDDVFLDNTQEIIEQRMKVVRAYRSQPPIRNYYRTCSYSGLPKGSYLLPNPRHFHIAHYTNINKPMRPHVINLASGKYSSFNPILPHRMPWDAHLRPTVTINIANTRTITLNISMQTLREFIYPFAAALNLNSLPDSKAAASQTSYHIEQSRVSLTAFSSDVNKETSTDTTSSSFGEFSEFESQILQTMRDNILTEANSSDNLCDFDSTQTITEQQALEVQNRDLTEGNLAGGDANEDVGGKSKEQSIPSFNDSNFIAFEGSGYEASDELTMSILEKTAVHTQFNQSSLDNLKEESEDIGDANLSICDNLSTIDEVMKIADTVTDTALKIVKEYSIFEDVVNETLSLFKELPFPDDLSKISIIESIDKYPEHLTTSQEDVANEVVSLVKQLQFPNSAEQLTASQEYSALNDVTNGALSLFKELPFHDDILEINFIDSTEESSQQIDSQDYSTYVANEAVSSFNKELPSPDDITKIDFIDSQKKNPAHSTAINIKDVEIGQNIVNKNLLNREDTHDNHIQINIENTAVDNNGNYSAEIDIINKNIINTDGKVDNNAYKVGGIIHSENNYDNSKNIAINEIENAVLNLNVNDDDNAINIKSRDGEIIETCSSGNDEISEILEKTDGKMFDEEKHSTDTSDTQQYLTADDYSTENLNNKKENLSNKTKHSSDTEEGCEVELKNDGDTEAIDVLEAPSLSEDVCTFADYTNEESAVQDFPVNESNSDECCANQLRSSIDEISNNNPELQNTAQDSLDEGISGCKSTLNDSATLIRTVEADNRIITLSEIVYEYIVKQCYEITDLVLFPEVFCDENVIKMFAKLKEAYQQYYSGIDDADKTEVRIQMTNFILDKIKSSEEPQNCSNVSDKLFSISEFLSDIFDKFFDEYADALDSTDSWNGFANLLEKKEVCQSTPEDRTTPAVKDIPPHSPKRNTQEQQEDLTAFRARKSQSGCELYWISINRSPKNEEVATPAKVVVNVDDIPLRPPDDFPIYNKDYKRPLSPILEEAKCNLYNEFGKSPPQTPPALSMHVEQHEYHDNTDYLAGGDYVQFDRPEVDVMMNEAKFFRGRAPRRAYYVQSSSVTFHRNLELSRNNKDYAITCFSGEDCTDEGNWMGFEKAKF